MDKSFLNYIKIDILSYYKSNYTYNAITSVDKNPPINPSIVFFGDNSIN